MKILNLESDQYPKTARIKLEELGKVIEISLQSQQELENHLRQFSYDIIITRLGLDLNKLCIQSQPDLKYIVSSTTGLNHIDVDFALERGIKLISLKGEVEFLAGIKSTAEHTWALILALTRNILPATRLVRNGSWERSSLVCDELDQKTIGIIGYGRLGKILGGYARAFGMNVLVNDISELEMQTDTGVRFVTLDELLTQSDFIVLMISWSKENENFFTCNHFSKMKNGAYFINTSRGELVNEQDLLLALQSGILKGAAIDVMRGDSTWEKSIDGTNALLEYAVKNDNLIITPHIGGYGKDSIARTRNFVVKKLLNEIKLL